MYGSLKKFLKFIQYKYDNQITKKLEDLPPEDNPLRAPTFIRKKKVVLNKDEIYKLLEATKENPRDEAIFKVFHYTAQRKSSVAGINLSDIDWENGKIHFRAKGNREYDVPIHRDCFDAIKRYIDYYREKPREEHEDALFLNGYGQRLSVQTIYLSLKFYAIKAGIKKNAYPHLLRATSSTIMDESGMSLAQIKEITGHKSLQSLETYLRPSEKTVRQKANFALGFDNYKVEKEESKDEKQEKHRRSDDMMIQ